MRYKIYRIKDSLPRGTSLVLLSIMNEYKSQRYKNLLMIGIKLGLLFYEKNLRTVISTEQILSKRLLIFV